MVHPIERLGIWLAASATGVGLLYAAMTASRDTAAVLLGVLYVLGIALLAVGVLGFASEIVVAVHGRLPGTEVGHAKKSLPEVGRPIQPSLAPLPVPTQPAAPNGRVFVPPSVTPLFLVAFFEGHTDAQGKQSVADYLGKWMRVSGAVSNVQVFDTSAVITSYVDRITSSVMQISIGMWFPATEKERVRLLGRGDHIVVNGRIDSLSDFAIELRDCELVTER